MFIYDSKRVIFVTVVVPWWHCGVVMLHCGVVVTTTAQLHSSKPELRFCTGSNPVHSMLEIRNGEDL